MIYTVPPSYGDLGDGFYWVYHIDPVVFLFWERCPSTIAQAWKRIAGLMPNRHSGCRDQVNSAAFFRSSSEAARHDLTKFGELDTTWNYKPKCVRKWPAESNIPQSLLHHHHALALATAPPSSSWLLLYYDYYIIWQGSCVQFCWSLHHAMNVKPWKTCLPTCFHNISQYFTRIPKGMTDP